MSDVGTINVLGLGSGLDLQGILDQFREIESVPIHNMEDERDYYEQRLTEYDWLTTQVLDLKTSILNLSLESTFLNRQASVSGSAVEASADIGAVEGNYSVEVSQLARRSLWESSTGFSSSSDVVTTSDDVIQIAVGDQSFSVLVPADTTLEGLAELINEDENNPGIQASVINTGSATNPYKLILQSNSSGEDNRIVVTQELSSLSFEEVVAQPNIVRSGNYANSTDVVTSVDTSLTLQVGDLSPQTIDIPAGTTVEGLVDLINDSMEDTSLKAYLMRDSSGNYFIDLRSPEEITITDDPSSLFPNVVQSNGESLNAFLTVDGINYQRNSNSITDIIPGVTLTLKDTGTSNINISADYEGVKEQLSDFIEKANQFIQDIKQKMSVDEETGEEGPLYDSDVAESLIRDIQEGLLETISVSSGPQSLLEIGVDFARDGTITFDEDTFDQAMAEDPEGVERLLVGDEDNGIEGVAEKLSDTLQSYLGTTGLIALEQDNVEARIDSLNDEIEKAQDRVDAYISSMQKQFMALDAYIQELNDTSTYLDMQFKSILGLSENK